MKKRLFVVVLAVMLTMALTGCGVKQTNDTITHEAGQELVINATEHFNVDEKKAAKFEFDTSAVDVNKVGTYEVAATYKNKDFTLTVNVVDTTAPMIEFASRCVFTNDLVNTDFTNALEGVYDASEYTTKLIRFEEYGNLEVMDENAVKSLTDKIPVPCIKEELEVIGTEDVPEEPGIYRSVLEIKDVHGNTRLEEVYVVYDTTGARIEDVADKTVRVAKEDLDKEPEINKKDYTITDNVDGKIHSDDITCELELRDEDKHEWLVHVSYTDRAGNESKADFLIIVKEKSSNSSKKEESNTDNKTEGSASSSSTSSSNKGSTSVSTTEEITYEYPHIEAALQAGIGNVVYVNGIYCVCGDSNGYINGTLGIQYLDNYLLSMGLFSTDVSGGMANESYTYFMAMNVQTLPSEMMGETPDSNGVIWVN